MICRLILDNAEKVRSHPFNVVLVLFDNRSPKFQFTDMIKVSLDGTVIPAKESVYNETPCCGIMDMRNFPPSPQHLDDFYKWKKVFTDLNKMHPKIMNIPVWMVIVAPDQEKALQRLEAKIFTSYNIVEAVYNHGFGRVRHCRVP